MAKGSFASKVLEKAQELAADGNEFSAADLSRAVGVRTYRDNKRMHWVIRDLKKAGKLTAVHVGVYRTPNPGAAPKPAPKKQEIMWRTLRGRRSVSIDDLVEFSAATPSYARQWVRMLIKRGVVRDLGNGKFQLIKDSVEDPKDTEKAEKLRALRAEQRRQMYQALHVAKMEADQMAEKVIACMTAIQTASLILTDMEAQAIADGEVPA